MSFSEDPYKHVSIRVRGNGLVAWECNGCGAESDRGNSARQREVVLSVATEFAVIASSFWAHVLRSHELSPDDTKDWS